MEDLWSPEFDFRRCVLDVQSSDRLPKDQNLIFPDIVNLKDSHAPPLRKATVHLETFARLKQLYRRVDGPQFFHQTFCVPKRFKKSRTLRDIKRISYLQCMMTTVFSAELIILATVN